MAQFPNALIRQGLCFGPSATNPNVGFPTALIRQALCCGPSKQIYHGSGDPNGIQVGNKFDIFVSVDSTTGQAFIYIKTVEGGSSGWV